MHASTHIERRWSLVSCSQMTKRKSCFSLKSLEIMICSLGETGISERLMAPWTEKKKQELKWEERSKSDSQTLWTCTELLIRCTKSRECLWKTSSRASLPAILQIRALISESEAKISISTCYCSPGACITMMQQHCSWALWHLDLVWRRGISADSFVALSTVQIS